MFIYECIHPLDSCFSMLITGPLVTVIFTILYNVSQKINTLFESDNFVHSKGTEGVEGSYESSREWKSSDL